MPQSLYNNETFIGKGLLGKMTELLQGLGLEATV
jgi:hypothetical protein